MEKGLMDIVVRYGREDVVGVNFTNTIRYMVVVDGRQLRNTHSIGLQTRSVLAIKLSLFTIN